MARCAGSDLSSMVLRDRNAPSIVMWSIGNEIPNRHDKRGAELLDVAGYNYSPEGYVRDHATHPQRLIAATETYPIVSVHETNALMDYPWVVGTFIWTAIDYIGESSIGANGHSPPDIEACGDYCPLGWAYHSAFCGDLDLVGGQKPQAFLRRVLWNVSALEMAVKPADDGEVIAQWGFPDERQSWTWDVPGRLMQVNLYSSTAGACVVLALNGANLTSGCTPVSDAAPCRPLRSQLRDGRGARCESRASRMRE